MNQTTAALVAVLLWSTNALTARYVLDRAEVSWLLLLEGLFATVTLVVVRSRSTRQPGPSPRAVLLGVVGLAGTMSLQYLAYAHAPVVAANVLTYVWPLVSAAWFAATVRTRRSVASGVCAAVGFAGVAVVLTDGAGGTGAGLGYLFALASAGCMAVFTIAVPHSTGTADVLLPGTVATMLLAAGWVIARHSPAPAAIVWPVALFMGAGQMAAGYLLWSVAMRGDGASRLAGLGYATPLLSTVLLLATGTPATAATLLSVGLILLGSIGTLVVDRARRRPGTVSRGQPAKNVPASRKPSCVEVGVPGTAKAR